MQNDLIYPYFWIIGNRKLQLFQKGPDFFFKSEATTGFLVKFCIFWVPLKLCYSRWPITMPRTCYVPPIILKLLSFLLQFVAAAVLGEKLLTNNYFYLCTHISYTAGLLSAYKLFDRNMHQPIWYQPYYIYRPKCGNGQKPLGRLDKQPKKGNIMYISLSHFSRRPQCGIVGIRTHNPLRILHIPFFYILIYNIYIVYTHVYHNQIYTAKQMQCRNCKLISTQQDPC